MAGRPPKPTKILELEKGKLYSDQRDRAELEPQAERCIEPKCPTRFNRQERREWRFFRDILKNYGLFNVANAPFLEFLAANSIKYKECAKIVAEKGIVVKDKLGQPIPNPFWKEMNRIEEKMNKNLDALGLGTKGLAKIGALALKAKKQKSEMESLLD